MTGQQGSPCPWSRRKRPWEHQGWRWQPGRRPHTCLGQPQCRSAWRRASVCGGTQLPSCCSVTPLCPTLCNPKEVPRDGLQHTRLPCPSPSSSLLKLMSVELKNVFASLRVFTGFIHIPGLRLWGHLLAALYGASSCIRADQDSINEASAVPQPVSS